MTAWQALEKQANADTAAAVVQNVTDASLPFSAANADEMASTESLSEGVFYGPVTSAAANAGPANQLDYQWWKR